MKISTWVRQTARKVAFAVAGDPERLSGTTWADQWRTQESPTSLKLLDAYREMAYACANINATAVATVPIRLFATNPKGSRRASSLYNARRIEKDTETWLKSQAGVQRKLAGVEDVEEIFEHPLLTLLSEVNAFLNGFNLMELTDLYQEMVGRAYWYIDRDAGTKQPSAIWILPPQFVTPVRAKDDPQKILSHYKYATGGSEAVDLAPENVIAFQFPNLRDPYLGGWSPARAAWETINLLEKDNSYAAAMMDNRARPDVFVSAKDGIGPEEQYRLEKKFSRKFGRGGAGGVLVGDGDMSIDMLAWPPKDMEALARAKVSKRNLANMFGVPLTFLETETVSRANAEAGHYQHAKFAVLPRLTRHCEVLNHGLVPRYSDRLFLWFDDPVPADRKLAVSMRKVNLDTGTTTINEERADDGKPPVAWGEKPWLKGTLTQPSDDAEENARRVPPPAPPGQSGAEEDPDKQKPDQTDEEPKKFFGNLQRSHRAISGLPGPTRRQKTPSVSLDEASWASLPLLCAHFAGDLTRSATVDRLRALGIDPAVAVRWTEPVLTAPPACACGKYHNETDAEVPHPEWYKAPDVDGHGRRLPRGAKLGKVVKAVFKEQRREVLRDLGVSVKSPNLNYTVDLSDWDDDLARRARPAIQITYEQGLKEAAARLGVTSNADVWNVHLRETQEAIDRAAFNFSKATNAATSMQLNQAMAKLRQDLAAGIVGEINTPRELARRVSGVFDRAERYRVDRIALTESSRAVHSAQRIAAKKSGVVKGYKWLLSGDACQICQSIKMAHPDGIGMEDAFGEVGNNPTYRAVQQPPAHPNCMCTMVEILSFEGEGVEEGGSGSLKGEAFKKEFNAWEASLTDDERKIFKQWGKRWRALMNADKGHKVKPEITRQLELLKGALGRAPKHDTKLYRGMAVPDKVLKTLQKAKSIKLGHLQSFSQEWDTAAGYAIDRTMGRGAHKIVWRIKNKSGRRVYGEKLTGKQQVWQTEHVVLKDTEYKVTRARWEKHRLYPDSSSDLREGKFWVMDLVEVVP